MSSMIIGLYTKILNGIGKLSARQALFYVSLFSDKLPQKRSEKNISKQQSKQRLKFIRPLLTYCFLAIPVTSAWAMEYPEYSSAILEGGKTQSIRTYEYRHLQLLRKPVIPRAIHYIHSGNRHGSAGMGVRGILFTHKDERASLVKFVGSQNRYKPISMKRNRYGIWYLVLEIPDYKIIEHKKEIRYKFMVDSLYVLDHTHENRKEVTGGGISVYYLTQQDMSPVQGYIITNKKVSYGKEVLFRVHAPQAYSVSLMGSFNLWNQNMDIMKKDTQGWFTIYKVLAPGEYVYAFQVDSQLIPDQNNRVQKKHPIFKTVSFLEVGR